MRTEIREKQLVAAEALLAIVLVLLLGYRMLPEPDRPPPPPADELTHRIDLNHAPWHELMNLPGIGEKKARAIVRDREERGPYPRVEDLARVRGIGPATVERIRIHIDGD